MNNQEKSILHKTVLAVKDLGKAFLIGAAAGVVLSLLLFLIGFFAGKFSLTGGLEVAKDGMFLISAIGFLILAGMLLIKGKKPEQFSEGNGWRKHFKIIGVKSVIGLVCVGILLVATIADYLMLLL
jgi:hypothetical protein